MTFSLAPLLIHHPAVPELARQALLKVTQGPSEHRVRELELAAKVIYRETELDCREARDLVGLGDPGCCG